MFKMRDKDGDKNPQCFLLSIPAYNRLLDPYGSVDNIVYRYL